MLHSPEKRTEQISAETEVHLALTPLQPIVFFGFHRRMSVTGLFHDMRTISSAFFLPSLQYDVLLIPINMLLLEYHFN